MVAGFEAEHHDGDAAVAGAGVVGLLRVEDAAVGGIEPGLRDGAHRARGGEELWKRTDAAGAEVGRGCNRIQAAVMTPRMPSEPMNMRSGLGPAPEPGQAARFQHAARRDHAQAFDEIVDMGVEAGEMAARAGRDPAAEGRIFEALREMAQASGRAA